MDYWREIQQHLENRLTYNGANISFHGSHDNWTLFGAKCSYHQLRDTIDGWKQCYEGQWNNKHWKVTTDIVKGGYAGVYSSFHINILPKDSNEV